MLSLTYTVNQLFVDTRLRSALRCPPCAMARSEDMPLTVNRLAFGLGAEVTGLDLRQPLSDGTIAEIRNTWLENLVLVFPGQQLSLSEHVAFSARFGKLEIHPQKHYRHP